VQVNLLIGGELNRASNKYWFYAAIINSIGIQASTYLSRPMITYKLLSLHVNSAVVGSFGAMYALIPLLIAVPLGRWINHFGEGKLIWIGTIFIAIVSLVFIPSNNIYLLAVATALLGTSQLLCMAGAQALFGNKSPIEGYEKYFGYYTFSASFGQLIGPMVGAAVLNTHSIIPKSTTPAFLAAALVAMIGFIPIINWHKMAPTVSQELKRDGTRANFKAIISNPSIKSAIFTSMGVASAIDILGVFLPVLGKERHLTVGVIATVLALRAFTSMLSRFWLGRLSAALGFARLLYWSIFLSSIGCIAIFLARTGLVLMICAAMLGATIGIGQPLTMSWVSRVAKESERSMAVSIRLAANRLGQFALPAVSGSISHFFGAGSVFLLLAATIGTSGGVAFRGLRDEGS
jgi:MFS family permease